jgi:hypothetical protein
VPGTVETWHESPLPPYDDGRHVRCAEGVSSTLTIAQHEVPAAIELTLMPLVGRHAAWRRRLLSRFGGCERPQHVELVTVRVGHDYPTDLALADIHPAGAECFQASHLGGLIAGPQI